MIPNKFQTQQHQQQQQQQQQQHLTFNPIPSPSSDIKQQLPLKAYFLNKYEQLKNPASTSPLTSLVTSNSSTNNNVVGFTQAPAATAATSSTTPAVSLDNSVLSVLLADSNNQNLIRAQLPVGSSSVNLISPTLAMFQQQQSAHLHHHIHNQPQISLQQIQQQQAPMQQSYHIHGGSILQQQFDSRQPVFLIESKDHTEQVNSSFMQKGTPVMMNNTPSKSSKGGAAASSSNAKRNFSGSNSSLQNSDDEDDDEFMDSGDPSASGNPDAKSKEEKRRLSHTAAEQKRRNAIKRGYDDLQGIVPSCDFMDPSSSQKVCKATVLKRWFELLQNVVPSCQQTDPILSTRITRATTLEQTIDHIIELEKEKDNHEKELDSLKKEIMALKIMKSNYDEILKYHQTPVNNNVEAAEETKFNLFVQFAENLFQSFNSSVNTSSFGELSASVMVNWLEQTCSMSSLKNIIFFSIYQTMKQMTH